MSFFRWVPWHMENILPRHLELAYGLSHRGVERILCRALGRWSQQLCGRPIPSLTNLCLISSPDALSLDKHSNCSLYWVCLPAAVPMRISGVAPVFEQEKYCGIRHYSPYQIIFQMIAWFRVVYYSLFSMIKGSRCVHVVLFDLHFFSHKCISSQIN